ncbi:MAG: transcriptional regulator [Proteobacteria bacterium]|jgi:DNA-binding XRE family transcriptional regulator|nr:MAG: transcriptional regulator [Pseudomonadota bacterium]
MTKYHPQFIHATDGTVTHAVLPAKEWQEIEDLLAVADVKARLARGEEELIPDDIVGSLLSGENPVKVWRAHRGMTQADLAKLAGVTQAYLSDIEAGKKTGSARVLKALAAALNIDLDDLV